MLITVGIKKGNKCNYAAKSYKKPAVRTTHVLHKTTDHTTQNYRPYYTKLYYTDYTTDKLTAHTTDTNQVSCTQIRHSNVATYVLIYTRN